MITINLLGGTGNQLFQWAFGRYIQAQGPEVQFDPRQVMTSSARCYMLEPLGLKLKLGWPTPPDRWRTITEPDLLYRPELLDFDYNTVYQGYWQCEKYFKSIEEKLRAEIQLGLNATPYALEIADQIRSANVSAFIHIRRSDNLSQRSILFHGVMGADYYDRALSMIRDYNRVKIFVFSDDSEYIKANMTDPDMIVVETPWCGIVRPDNEIEVRPGQGREHEDLWLMSLCNHGITANSSFSWWGSWLGDGDPTGRLIVTPKNWFTPNVNAMSRDIVPDRWIRI